MQSINTYVSHVEVHSHRGRAKEMRSVHRHSPIMTAAAHTRPMSMGRVLVRESLRAYTKDHVLKVAAYIHLRHAVHPNDVGMARLEQ